MSSQPTSSRSPFRRLGRDLWLVVGVAMAVWLTLALATYDLNDPGRFYTGSNQPAANAMGELGALISELALTAFGYLAFLLPLLLTWHCVSVLRDRRLIDLAAFGGWLKLLGWALIMMGAGGLCSLAWLPESGSLPPEVTAGGALGRAIAIACVGPMGFAGGAVVLVAMTALGLTLALAVRWVQVFEVIGAGIERAARNLAGRGGEKPQHNLALNRHWLARLSNPLGGLWSRFASRTQRAKRKETTRGQAIERVQQSDFDRLDDHEITAFDDAPEPLPPELDVPWQDDPIPDFDVGEVLPSVNFDAVPEPEPEPRAPAPVMTERVEPVIDEPAPMRKVTAFDKADLGVNTAAPDIRLDADDKAVNYKMPGLEHLIRRDDDDRGFSADELQTMGDLLEQRLAEFGVKATVTEVHPGPVVTRFEIQPAPGVKASRISNLASDLARSLAVAAVRVVEVIPGKSVVGVEIPNSHRRIIRLREVVASDAFTLADSPMTMALGHDISGEAVVANLAKMPHLLVAGTTGSGKSVGVNTMLVSMLYKAGPDEIRMILVDPKMLELSVYEGIPHLLAPVVTDMKEAANALRWCVGEMERRYKLMAAAGVRNLAGFNKKVTDARAAGTPMLDPLWTPDNAGVGQPTAPELETLPYIVVVIDEFADMMMIVGKKVEQLIARIAQKARAAGINMILATQRPSVDVITGLIKANVPTRMSFQVSSKIDSRTVLDQGGAEQLLGHGDMLFLPPGTSLPVRVHGCLVEDDEVHRVVEYWKTQGAPDLIPDILTTYEEGEGGASSGGDGDGNAEESDPLYDQAVEFVLDSRRASISAVQRKLKIGYNRSARIIEAMELAGLVTSMGSNGQREVIAPKPRRHE
ncbi:DNA translocase FtsK [Litorivicinus lipolyticus]|uniref:DNA translocase FtsK n=1 Tax=Litorivicinus lipolyticus TaxID=418701 RepID=UPI003B592093